MHHKFLQTDYELIWTDYKGVESCCRIRIFAGQATADGKKVVIMTDDASASGVSVTNGAAEIASLVVKQNNLNPGETVFIEHYERKAPVEDDFAEVNFILGARNGSFAAPQWKYLTCNIVGEIIGENSEK